MWTSEACEKCGEVEQTLALLADLKKQEDIVPDSYIFNIAMIACSKAVSVSNLIYDGYGAANFRSVVLPAHCAKLSLIPKY